MTELLDVANNLEGQLDRYFENQVIEQIGKLASELTAIWRLLDLSCHRSTTCLPSSMADAGVLRVLIILTAKFK